MIYNIHDIVTIRSDIELSLKNAITPAFDCFKTNKYFEECDLTITYIDSKDININKYRKIAYGLYYSKKENSIISDIKVLNIRVSWKITGLLANKTELKISKSYKYLSKYIVKSPISHLYPLCLLIRNIIQVKLLQKNSVFLTGAAATIGKQGMIFTGSTGSGKTNIMLRIMNNSQAKYISEDLIIAATDKIYSFPSMMLVRKYPSVGVLDHFIPNSHKYTCINPLERFKGRIIKSIKSDFKIYFIEQGSTSAITAIPFDEGIDKLCYLNNKIHSYFNERTLSVASYLYKGQYLLGLQKRQRDILYKCFGNSQFYILLVKFQSDTRLMFNEEINSIIHGSY